MVTLHVDGLGECVVFKASSHRATDRIISRARNTGRYASLYSWDRGGSFYALPLDLAEPVLANMPKGVSRTRKVDDLHPCYGERLRLCGYPA